MSTITIQVPKYMRQGETVPHEVPSARVSKSGIFAITTTRHKVYDVTHVATGRRLPAQGRFGSVTICIPGSDPTHKGFAKIRDAKAFMQAVDETGIFGDSDPTRADFEKFANWIEEVYS